MFWILVKFTPLLHTPVRFRLIHYICATKPQTTVCLSSMLSRLLAKKNHVKKTVPLNQVEKLQMESFTRRILYENVSPPAHRRCLLPIELPSSVAPCLPSRPRSPLCEEAVGSMPVVPLRLGRHQSLYLRPRWRSRPSDPTLLVTDSLPKPAPSVRPLFASFARATLKLRY
jgi:hypothetical protein